MNKQTSDIKRVLVTGNSGYIGSVLTARLASKGYTVIGYDSGFYGKECLLYENGATPSVQIRKDIRDAEKVDFDGVDAVIHLASLSNDPLGELIPGVTEDINYHATIRIAEQAKAAKVKRFTYASSQSMYGVSTTDEELDEENSQKNPITVYAKTKWKSECELRKMDDDKFAVVSFRPSTVFGPSPKLRCDIVYNNLVACAFTTGSIEIKSDGTPWRPVVHVDDVCDAFIAGLEAPKEIVAKESFNIGIPNGNFRIKEIAEAAQKAVSGSEVRFTGEHGADCRTYRVSFRKILHTLRDHFSPSWDLAAGGRQLVDLFVRVKFCEEDFRGERCNRLLHLKRLIRAKALSEDLRWLNGR